MGSSESALKRYIDSWGKIGRDRLRHLLKNESSGTRHNLLVNEKGITGVFSTWTGVHIGALINDLETVKCMLDGFSINQKYDVVKMQQRNKWTALHIAAANGHASIIKYLLSNLPLQQKYDLLKIQNEDGNTALHRAVLNEEVEAVQTIISSVSSHLLIQLLNIQNKQGQKVTDIKPELYDELPVLTREGRVSSLTAELKKKIKFYQVILV